MTMEAGAEDAKFEASQVHITCVLIDLDQGERLKCTFRVPMYQPQIHAFNFTAQMIASDIVASEAGIGFVFENGIYSHQPIHWMEWWEASNASEVNGLQALATMHAFLLWTQTRGRARGERGPNVRQRDRRNFLLAAVLSEIAAGRSRRQAVSIVLEEHEPASKARDEAALLRYVTRHLTRGSA
jgi:hypothetical protein